MMQHILLVGFDERAEMKHDQTRNFKIGRLTAAVCREKVIRCLRKQPLYEWLGAGVDKLKAARVELT